MLLSSICYGVTKYSTRKANIVYNYFNKTEYKNVADIITAMTILETGWYKSKEHIKRNNYFSIKRKWSKECNKKPILCMGNFKSLNHGFRVVLSYFRKRQYPNTKNGFYDGLIKHKYAEDPKYIQKVKAVVRYMKKKDIINKI